MTPQTIPQLSHAANWAPHPSAAPRCHRQDHAFRIEATGSRALAGGYDLIFRNLTPGQTLRLRTSARFHDIETPRDAIDVSAHWMSDPNADPFREQLGWQCPERRIERTQGAESGTMHFETGLRTPPGAQALLVRLTLRWTTRGRVEFAIPAFEPWQPPPRRAPLTIAVVTGSQHSRPLPIESIEQNTDYYLPRCEDACRDAAARDTKVGLIVLPEICLQWQIQQHPLDLAVAAPGPQTAPFQDLARRYETRLCLPMLEREGDAVYNSAVMISPAGEIDGKYRKVHLATGIELNSGVRPGDGFPVFDTEAGRIACNICMDSSRAESSRLTAIEGAEILLLPIMGDHRANRWSTGRPIFQEDRWRAVMRVHALDNFLFLVAARNQSQGSCIVDPKGGFAAWNEGDREHILGKVDLDRDDRTWTGSNFRAELWTYRRPSLYAPFAREQAPPFAP